ncbi:MAG: 2-C-methyl-D-erythritol 4-phosphate cytidylyltransferase [Pseudonocardia sp.]|nr:2-C-methyl-D-erythritol 4-phosphate cytidylyltransferase [Pseudonocardia sp.]
MSDVVVEGGAVWAIVLAAGGARRFGPRSKQFERLGGERMVDRTVGTARTACDGVVLVLPPGHEWDGPPVDVVVAGGDHRAESLRAGLAALPADAAIAVVADPAHPLAPLALFRSVIGCVRAGADGAVPVVPIHDVVQRVRDGRVVQTLPKDDLVITQTPQAYRVSVLRAVHADHPRPVEDSGLLVERGHRVETVPGEFANLHVTTPYELAVLDRIASERDAL